MQREAKALRRFVILAPILALLCAPSEVLARPGLHSIRLEGGGALMLTSPQTTRFDFGGGLAGEYELRPIPHFGVGARFSAYWFPSTNAAPTVDGYGAYYAPALQLRAHPLADLAVGDLWIGGAVTVTITGEVVRPGLELGMGYELDVHDLFRAGPYVRYHHVFETDGLPGAADAGFLSFGVSLSLLGEGEPDRDADGIADASDRCPDDPEDADGFEDADGCPDPDDDADGILDASDRCPREPEDADGFEDEDGCPDPDNDADRVLDATDRCPLEPEDPDGFEDEDGCPDTDNDGDGILDADDRCPNEAGIPEQQGCPAQVRVEVERGVITVLHRVEFETNSEVILPESDRILQNVADVLRENPQLASIRVEGHTDSRDEDAYNMDLSRRRARSVVLWLVGHGIEAARLEAWGCGELHPITSNDTEQGMQANRRVEFHILRPPPPSGARSLPGCERIEHDTPRERGGRRSRRSSRR